MTPGAPAQLLTTRFALITASGLAYFTGWTMLYPILPRFVADELGGGGLAVGTSIGIFGVSAALLRPLVGRWGDRNGRRVLTVGGMAVVAASLLGYLLVDSVAEAIALRLVFGAGEAAAFVGLATAVQDLAPPERRGEAASYFSVASFGGVAAGPPLGQWLFDRAGGGPAGFDRVWVGAAAMVLVGLVFGLAVPGRSGRPEPPSTGADPLAARSTAIAEAVPGGRARLARFVHPASLRPGLALCLALGGYSGFVSFVALFMSERGLGNPGVIFTMYAVIIVAFRLVFAKAPDRYGARLVSSISCALLGAGLLLIAALGNRPGLYIGVVLFGAGMAVNFPAMLAVVVNLAGPDQRTFAVASLSAFFDVGFALGAPVVGLVVKAGGVRSGLAVGGLMAWSALIVLRGIAPRPQPALIG
ncbi:MAG: MFS transporter [Acidimicrobiia bacterium]|nr:MFS transporter [Acidimicrobiia bacterium]